MNRSGVSVLIITNSLGGGGAESTMALLHKELSGRGIDTTLLAINRDEFSKGILERNQRVLNRRWKDGIFGTFKAALELRSYLNSNEITHLIINCELPELLLAFQSTKNMKVICVEHTSRPWLGRKGLGIIVRRILTIKRATWVTVVKNQKVIWGTHQVPRYIPNPFIGSTASKNKGSSGMDIVYVGRLRKEKRAEIAIEAALANNRKIDVFGDGQQRDLLENLFAANPLVTFHGFVRNPWEIVREGALIVVPSEYEGDGLVVIESILNNHPLLLADNEDLRRFALPNANYFTSKEDLIEKIKASPINGYGLFRVPEEIRIGFASTRDSSTVVKEWETLLT